MKAVLLAFSVCVALLSVGCKSSCRQLSEKLCECTGNTNDRNNCLALASTKESSNPPNDVDNNYCKSLLTQCDCRLIDTTEGKIRCGLAYPLDGGSVASAPAQ